MSFPCGTIIANFIAMYITLLLRSSKDTTIQIGIGYAGKTRLSEILNPERAHDQPKVILRLSRVNLGDHQRVVCFDVHGPTHAHGVQ
jgi:hypothetical protein